MFLQVKRGEIYLANLKGSKHIQQGVHPVIIVQNDIGNKYSPNVTVVPISSKIQKAKLPTQILLHKNSINNLKLDSMAMAEAIVTISKDDILSMPTGEVKRVGVLTQEEMKQVMKAVSIQLQLQLHEDKETTEKAIREQIEKEIAEQKLHFIIQLSNIVAEDTNNTTKKIFNLQLKEFDNFLNNTTSINVRDSFRDLIVTNNITPIIA